MVLLNKIKYYYSKFILYIQIPSVKNSMIDKTAKIGHRSNIVNSKIDRYTYCGNNNSISYTKIGSFTSIASFCAIGGEEHPLNEISTSPLFYEKNNCFRKFFAYRKENIKPLETLIGNDVWIGESCFIKPGVKIGNGAVIGAHSVVTTDVPAYAVVVGAPARIINYRFDELTINDLEKICWWNWDEDKLLEYGRYFKNPDVFIKKVKD